MNIPLYLVLSLFLFVPLLTLSSDENAEKLILVSVKKIWDKAKHNAFTDLVEFNGVLFCTFREADEHAESKDGSIRILMSKDEGNSWVSVAELSKKGFDLRDPKFSVMPNGRLMLSMGGSIYREKKYLGMRPQVAFSEDGIHWSDIQEIHLPEEWIWRVSWHNNIGYGIAYRLTDPSDLTKPWIATLFKTVDGIHYAPITQLNVTEDPSEGTIRFLPDGSMVALMRRDGNGWIGTSKPPYEIWKWTDAGYRFGGPNFLILPNGEMWAASRLIEKKHAFTAISRLTPTSYTPELTLPSGGDTSYPGMVYKNGILYVSYYSSHEGKTSIYFAKINVPD